MDSNFIVSPSAAVKIKTDASINYYLAYLGSYDVTVDYKWLNNQKTLTFKVNIVDPCGKHMKAPAFIPD